MCESARLSKRKKRTSGRIRQREEKEKGRERKKKREKRKNGAPRAMPVKSSSLDVQQLAVGL